MDKLEINDQFAVILFEDKTGGAWCKKVTGAEARLILGMASALNEVKNSNHASEQCAVCMICI
ncbi:hypothetical protein QA208_001099 [Escherichia coli]|nr:hypothetical protein [Escherichia coli]